MPNKSYLNLKPMFFSIEWYYDKLNSVGPTRETTAGNVCELKLFGAGWDMVTGK